MVLEIMTPAKGVTLGKVDSIEYPDTVVVFLQQSAALDHDTAFGIGDDERNRIVL